MYLQLMKNPTKHELNFYFGDKVIFAFKRSKIVFYNESSTSTSLRKWQFVPANGTLIINPVDSCDLGMYRVESFEKSSGKRVGDRRVQLIIGGNLLIILQLSNTANEQCY